MADLLFECLSEEVPAKMQTHAVKYAERMIIQKLHEHDLNYSNIRIFTTPRRLTIIIEGLPIIQNAKVVEVKGPRVNAPQQAIDGFLKKFKKNKEDLEIKKTPKGEFFFAVDKINVQPIQITLKVILEDLLTNFEWSKSMRWGNTKTKWIRPITSLLCLFENNVIEVEFAELIASNYTYGHRFKSGRLEIVNLEDYLKKLAENYVILDQSERFNLIKKECTQLIKNNDLLLNIDNELLEEITGLVEYPTVLLGKIDDQFMSLPKQLLITVMKKHQKYHHVLDNSMSIAPFFIVVSNNGNKEKVVKGNEKVLRARLADAKFMIDNDLKDSLENYTDKLSKIVFHTKLGSLKEKVERITVLANYISVWVPGASIIDIAKAAKLIKADFATSAVQEFAELKGIIGSYYARYIDEKQEIIDAIQQHYYPLNPDSQCTNNPIAITLAIADKIDTIMGIMSISGKISSSSDSFALRRSATGIIRTIVENDIALPLNLVIEKAAKLYPHTLFKKKNMVAHEDKKLSISTAIEAVINFCYDRLKHLLKGQGINTNTIASVMCNVPNTLYKSAQGLHEALNSSEGEEVLSAYKRIKNILSEAEKARKLPISKNYQRALFTDDIEVQVTSLMAALQPDIIDATKNHDIKFALQLLYTLSKAINKFIDDTLINHNNKNIQKNRLRILASARFLFMKVADFNML